MCFPVDCGSRHKGLGSVTPVGAAFPENSGFAVGFKGEAEAHLSFWQLPRWAVG